MKVAIVGGAGSVGSTVAYTVALTVPDAEVVLVETDREAGEGHATDVAHASNHASHPIGRRIAGTDSPATVPVVAADATGEAVADCDCVVVVYNVERPDEAVGRGGRDAYYRHNAAAADEIGDWLREREPCPVVVVTNPVDRIARRIWKRSGWPRRSFVGYSLSETARAAAEIARLRDARPEAVRCPTMGVHGEQVVPVFSRATVGGRPLDLDADERQRVRDYVRDVPYRVMEQRGAEESSRWVSGRGVAAVVHALALGGVDDPVCLSVPLEGEYGYEDVCMSVPVTLSGTGWETIRRWELAPEERDLLDAGYDYLRERVRAED
jgi:malate dehydrogenase